jgi:hypothetical protein
MRAYSDCGQRRAPTATHFVIRYTVHSEQKVNDYTEGLDCTRPGETLVIRYFFSGKLWGATLNAHAAGTLVPTSPSPPSGTVASGHYDYFCVVTDMGCAGSATSGTSTLYICHLGAERGVRHV